MENRASDIENRASVENSYDAIARSWDKSRQGPSKQFPALMPFISSRFESQSSANFLDAGCGTSRNSIFLAKQFPNFSFCCCDVSSKMVEISRENAGKSGVSSRFSFDQASLCALPYEESFFQAAISIAVLHHLDSQESRQDAFSELFRVLAKGGLLLVTVWNKDQERFDGVAGSDAQIPWSDGPEKALRYYHFFSEGELVALAKGAGFGVVDCFFEKGGCKSEKRGAANLCVALEKAL